MRKLPVVDLALPSEQCAEDVRRACIRFGFFYVTNHGIATDLLEEQLEQSKAFFSQPASEKLKILADKNNRGYTPMEEETLSPATQSKGDTKEGLYFGREIAAHSPEASKPLHGANQWPDPAKLPRFQGTMMRYFSACTKLGFRLLEVLAMSLGLMPTFFNDKFDPPMAFLRPLHYSPEASAPDAGVYGAGAHTDYGMLTILHTDGSPGLQILHGRHWIDVDHVPGALIVNLGDMLERWTNGRYKSTVHRVVSTTRRDRYSTPFFFEPNFDARVQCLPSCCVDEPPRYPPTTAGRHLLQKYGETHSAFEQEGGM